MVFLRNITRKRAQLQTNGNWETMPKEKVLQAEGMQLAVKYIGRQQETVAQQEDLFPLLEVYAREMGYM